MNERFFLPRQILAYRDKAYFHFRINLVMELKFSSIQSHQCNDPTNAIPLGLGSTNITLNCTFIIFIDQPPTCKWQDSQQVITMFIWIGLWCLPIFLSLVLIQKEKKLAKKEGKGKRGKENIDVGRLEDEGFYYDCLLFWCFEFMCTVSLVKLHIFQIKKCLTHDQKKHHGREQS